MRLGVVRNPRSGRGSGNWTSIEARLREHFPDVEVLTTTGPGSARAQAQELANTGCDVVAAAGGDGTVCDVMQGLLGTGVALAVVPMGTGNDFARTLGFGPSIEKAISALINGKTQAVDVAHWTHGSTEGHFINVAGCGFDADVARRVNEGFRFLHGRSAYVAAILASLSSYQPSEMIITMDGEEGRVRAMLVAIANARSYGGGMLVAPNADISDGLLDIVIVGEVSKFEFLRCFPQVLSGRHPGHPKVSSYRCRSIQIVSESETPFLADGELLEPGSLTVEVVPSAIQVVIP